MSRSLQFDIVANDKATGTLKGVQGAAANFSKSIGGMVAGMFALQAVVSRVTAFGADAFRWASGLGEAAAGIGITTTELQQLQYVASQSGVEVGKLNKAFLDLRKIMRDAQGGNAQAVAVMEALGYSQKEVKDGSVGLMDAFLKVSAAISAAKTEQEKFNVATAIFGDKVATDMIKALGDYGTLKTQIEETPLVSDDDIKALDEYGDRIDKATLKLKVLFATILGGSGKHFTEVGPGEKLYIGMPWESNDSPTDAPTTTSTPEAAAAAASLASLGAKAVKAGGGIGGAKGSEQFTALQQIGGAAGFRAGASSSPELAALEQIEMNTRPTAPIPANGSTNFSATDTGSQAFRDKFVENVVGYFQRTGRSK